MHNKVALPLVLYPRSPYLHPAQYDCDCACALDLPAVLSGPAVVGLYDCDCACALDLPTTLSVPSAAASYDCDCACALELFQKPIEQRAPAVWIRQSQAVPVLLEGGWQAYFNPAGPVGVAVLNTEAQRVLAAFDAPVSPDGAAKHLPGMPPAVLREAIEGLAQVGLVRPTAISSAFPVQPSTLSAWLHVTEACSLNCPYCYVHKHAKAMSLEVGRQAVDRLVEVASRHGYRSLKLKYAGGEPTLNFPLIRTLHGRAASRAAEAGLALEEVILSNGVGMTDAVLDAMAQTGMRLMISLDGDQATHDRVRARWDGAGTYAAVVRTVERAVERGLQPTISITLTALNLDGASAAVTFALERDLPFNLNFYRECAVADSAGLPSLLVPNPGRLVETMLRIFDIIRACPTYPLSLTGILDRTRLDVPHQHPCSAGRDYMVVDTEGRASACQMLLDEPWASLADEDPLDSIRQRGERIFRPVDTQSECHVCSWRMACSGGCPLMRGTALHDWYCQVYKTLLPELVRLEANRLIATLVKETDCHQSRG